MSTPTNLHRHHVDVTALVFGLVFLGTVAVWSLSELGYVSRDDAGWLLPIVLVGAGVLGVALAATRERRLRSRVEDLAGPATPHPRADDDTTAAVPAYDRDDPDAQTDTEGGDRP